MTPLRCTIRPEGHALTLALHGELTHETTGILGSWLDRVDDDYDRVDVDLTDVTFLDSSGLNVLARAGEHLRERSRTCALVVTNASPHLRHVFEIAGLEQFLELE